MKECDRPGRTRLPLSTQPRPSALSLELPNATTSPRWMKTPPSVCVAGVLRNWSSTLPASCWGRIRLPPASTPPTPAPSSSGSMGYSSWRSTTRQMVMGLLHPEGCPFPSLLCVLYLSKRSSTKNVSKGARFPTEAYVRVKIQMTENRSEFDTELCSELCSWLSRVKAIAKNLQGAPISLLVLPPF